MTKLALSMYVLEVTGSAVIFAGILSAATIPTIILSPLGGILSVVKQDFLSSMRYISKEQTNIAKMLLLTAFSRFFVVGITVVGLPFIVRTVLRLNAQYYGAAESALAIATILGSVAAGLLTEKLKIYRLSILLASMGVFMIPAGIAFLCPVASITKYAITIVSKSDGLYICGYIVRSTHRTDCVWFSF